MMTGLLTAAYFLVSVIFTLILFLLWSRVILRYYRLSPLHPVNQSINALIGPVLGPIERMIQHETPGKPRKAPSQYDWPGFALIIVIEIIKFICLGLLAYGRLLPVPYLLLFVLADLIVQPLNLLFFALLIRVIMSWVNPHWEQQNPAGYVINLMTNPLIRIGHKLIPNISGFDFAPYIVMIIIKVITLFISASMPLPLV
ncbi:YggT family protein [Legionella birminghamensis]|uniref:Integral membrane protein YggT, involved in response to extracytoplasmic stress (Osmotic shock) n=1 Tax=Legionella birminghamensis TaxID=28083 RepID=A0A378IAZ2_9GAMM|nr:YggT family protein [Legionella birminghamensis]KTC71756.1 YggT family protein [Legionella birminghamensis]STX32407.1 Integral membrane protein YggT, involved in response to extracytoplasmic stress (osmotic shock) [Legionella birminghamensis]